MPDVCSDFCLLRPQLFNSACRYFPVATHLVVVCTTLEGFSTVVCFGSCRFGVWLWNQLSANDSSCARLCKSSLFVCKVEVSMTNAQTCTSGQPLLSHKDLTAINLYICSLYCGYGNSYTQAQRGCQAEGNCLEVYVNSQKLRLNRTSFDFGELRKSFENIISRNFISLQKHRRTSKNSLDLKRLRRSSGNFLEVQTFCKVQRT